MITTEISGKLNMSPCARSWLLLRLKPHPSAVQPYSMRSRPEFRIHSQPERIRQRALRPFQTRLPLLTRPRLRNLLKRPHHSLLAADPLTVVKLNELPQPTRQLLERRAFPEPFESSRLSMRTVKFGSQTLKVRRS